MPLCFDSLLVYPNRRAFPNASQTITGGTVSRKAASYLAILFALLAGTSIFSLPAVAGTHMRATLTIPADQINSGSSFQVSYSTSGVPASARIYLQRQYGTAHVWK